MMDLNITRVMINTNGRRISRDDKLLEFLHQHRKRIEIYLQFDGFRPSTYLKLRGEDVAAEKLTALQRLNDAGVFTTLVATVARGINEDEVGDIVLHGLSLPRCAGVALQPMFGSGRVIDYDPCDRVTPTEIFPDWINKPRERSKPKTSYRFRARTAIAATSPISLRTGWASGGRCWPLSAGKS